MNRPEPAADQRLSDASASDYLRAAEAAFADGELTLAEKHAEEALRLCDGVDARIEGEGESFLANIAMQRGRHRAAEGRYRRAAELFEALQDQTAVGRLLAAVGALQLKQGQYAAAVKEWQGAVARLPGDFGVQVDLARAFSYSGQLQAAVAVYNSVLTVAPEFADALSGRGQIRADLGDAATALEDLRRLTALHPQYEQRPDIRSARGLALAVLGRTDQVAPDISAARRDAPDDGTVLLRAAKVAHIVGDQEVALRLARNALSARREPLLPHQAAEADMILGALPDGGELRP
jgi:tetratricopeptide (TPR) repeat protein